MWRDGERRWQPCNGPKASEMRLAGVWCVRMGFGNKKEVRLEGKRNQTRQGCLSLTMELGLYPEGHGEPLISLR